MKKRIKILKKVQSYETGRIYRVSPHFGDKLIQRGQAVEVKNEKKTVETKEEKFENTTLETKPYVPKSFAEYSIKKLTGMVGDFTLDELADLLKDERISAIRLAQEEIKRREG